MTDFLSDYGVVVALVCAALAVAYGLLTTRSLLALSRLEMAYVQKSGGGGSAPQEPAQPEPSKEAPQKEGPGPAQQSGRLWVPGQ